MLKDTLTLALLTSNRISLSDAKTLYDIAGNASVILENRKDIRQVAPNATERLSTILQQDISEYQKKAEEEIEWCQQNKVDIRIISDKDYPHRLRNCHDAPLALFTRGKADLNASYIIDIVGTRQCTPYGQDCICSIVSDLSKQMPGITIVSGLAYGIDINAHRAALKHHLPTIGVVAHGQDTLYPNIHRKEANEMCLGNGAVVTEFFHGTKPVAQNFLQRNRIIAGMSDATIVIESAAHGGGLVTARIAQDYGREVFAVPGPISSPMSAGTNNLIRDNKAALITSAQDIIDMMLWNNATQIEKHRKNGIERSLFVELTPDEQLIVDTLNTNGDTPVNAIAINTKLPINTVTTLLFTLEMKGIVKAMSGNTYHLIK